MSSPQPLSSLISSLQQPSSASSYVPMGMNSYSQGLSALEAQGVSGMSNRNVLSGLSNMTSPQIPVNGTNTSTDTTQQTSTPAASGSYGGSTSGSSYGTGTSNSTAGGIGSIIGGLVGGPVGSLVGGAVGNTVSPPDATAQSNPASVNNTAPLPQPLTGASDTTNTNSSSALPAPMAPVSTTAALDPVAAALAAYDANPNPDTLAAYNAGQAQVAATSQTASQNATNPNMYTSSGGLQPGYVMDPSGVVTQVVGYNYDANGKATLSPGYQIDPATGQPKLQAGLGYSTTGQIVNNAGQVIGANGQPTGQTVAVQLSPQAIAQMQAGLNTGGNHVLQTITGSDGQVYFQVQNGSSLHPQWINQNGSSAGYAPQPTIKGSYTATNYPAGTPIPSMNVTSTGQTATVGGTTYLKVKRAIGPPLWIDSNGVNAGGGVQPVPPAPVSAAQQAANNAAMQAGLNKSQAIVTGQTVGPQVPMSAYLNNSGGYGGIGLGIPMTSSTGA